MKELTKDKLKELAKETKDTNRLFRIIVTNDNGSTYGVYLFKGKFYRSDIFNIQYVIRNVKPSVTNLSNDYLHNTNEITDQNKLINLYNIR